MSINHSQLRSFHAVATEGSFTKAANMLHVTQPTLSGQVKALEEQFGVRLFDRRKRRIELTDIGRNLFDIAAIKELGFYYESVGRAPAQPGK